MAERSTWRKKGECAHYDGEEIRETPDTIP